MAREARTRFMVVGVLLHCGCCRRSGRIGTLSVVHGKRACYGCSIGVMHEVSVQCARPLSTSWPVHVREVSCFFVLRCLSSHRLSLAQRRRQTRFEHIDCLQLRL